MPRPALSLLSALLLAGLAAPGPALAQQEPQDGSFNLQNRSNRAIERLYASPRNSSDWGEDQLGDRPALENGASLAVRMPPDGGCRTDLRIGFAGGVVEERRDIDTCADRDVVIGTPARTGALRAGRAARRFTLRNEGEEAIQEVYASLTSEDDWGRDRLGDDVLPAHERRAIRLPGGGCQYDLRVVWEDGRAEERRDVNLCDAREQVFR